MKKILVSAFRAFGSYPVNSSEQVAKALEAEPPRDFDVSTEIFDANISWQNRGDLLLSRARLLRAQAIICLGMASSKRGLCIETCAHNRISNEKYCPPEMNNTPIDGWKPYNEKCPVDLGKWNVDRFRQACLIERVPIEFSGDAGGYCCNHLMYQLVQTEIEQPVLRGIPWIFIHIPCSKEAVPLGEDWSGKTTLSPKAVIRGLNLLLLHARL